MASNGLKYLDGLNEPQKEAVLHTEGPLLIVAGAGAGKTKTITHRIAHLIESGVPAHRILAVTFTNKAAGEMQERVRHLAPGGRGAPAIATFHSLGARILREFRKEAGVARGFTIWDRDDSLRALKRILGREGGLAPKAALARICRAKGEGVAREIYEADARDFRERATARAWRAYDEALAEEHALDFDDLLLKTLSLLRESEGVRASLQRRWTHITIDEYQDCSASQYEIARLLAGGVRNICVVGDIDQNIYSWRGADVERLLGFETAFPGTKVVTLEQNYRSTRTILSAANAVIEKNLRRRPKKLFTEKETGEPIAWYEARNETDEAWFAASKARDLVERGTRPGEIAMLYRENFQSRALEEALLHAGLPYRVLGTRFFERKEVKDALSYLRAATNPRSRTDLARIIAVPRRGIGRATLEKMLEGKDAALPAAARAKAARFRETLANIGKGIGILPASEAVRYCLEESGIERMLQSEDGHGGERAARGALEGRERLENVRELVNFATRYDDMRPPEGIEKLLEEAALQSEQDQLEEPLEAISLMTAHASKGLEFDAVFVTGLEQGLFPSLRESEAPGGRDPEEERRLFYVAMTRAKKRLFLSYARERMRYGSREAAIASEFFEDIDQRLVEYARPEGEYEKEEETIR